MRLSADVVGDYEVLEINSIENGANDQTFVIYANHGTVTRSIPVRLTKRIYSGEFLIETEDGKRFEPNSSNPIVLSGLNKIQHIEILEPNGDGRYKYSMSVINVTDYVTFSQNVNSGAILDYIITNQPERVKIGTLKITCSKLINPSIS
jgi:hypothetical protein